MSAVNLDRSYRLTSGFSAARPVVSPKPEPPEDPVVPTPTGCKHLRAMIAALTERYGSRAKVADEVGVSARSLSTMAVAKPHRERAFSMSRALLATVARHVDPCATVEDLLAGRLLAKVRKEDA